MITVNEECDLCGSDYLTLAYKPPTSVRGLSVYVCIECGLVQSLPRIDHVPARDVAVSSGADWGNIRYGKGFRTDHAIKLLKQVIDLSSVRYCLDIGSNRGSFVLCLRELAPRANILAIEPDGSIVEDYSDTTEIELLVDRIENVTLSKGRFDLVYCSHTLEHLRSPRQLLKQVRQAMASDGVLFLEVPSLDFISRSDVVEEWFIDKHLYHFCNRTLRGYLKETGFRVVENLSTGDSESITLIALRGEASADIESQADDNVCFGEKNLRLISEYQELLRKNHADLQGVARRIETRASLQPIVVWGAGRIFDSLVQYGGLDVSVLAGIVDKHLVDHVEQVHGCQLLHPRELSNLDPEVVIIASRTYFDEIREELSRLVSECDVLGMDSLLGLESGLMANGIGRV